MTPLRLVSLCMTANICHALLSSCCTKSNGWSVVCIEHRTNSLSGIATPHPAAGMPLTSVGGWGSAKIPQSMLTNWLGTAPCLPWRCRGIALQNYKYNLWPGKRHCAPKKSLNSTADANQHFGPHICMTMPALCTPKATQALQRGWLPDCIWRKTGITTFICWGH